MPRPALAPLLALLLAGFTFGLAGARAADSAEYQIKAAFLYRFAQFTEWPASALAGSDQLMLCVLGEDPFDGLLNGIAGNTVHQRKLAVQRLTDLQQLSQCHIAFVGAMRPDTLSQVIKRSRQLNVLTVADQKGFAAGGGIIQFVIANDRVQFEINSAAADKAGLKLSSHLLKLARTLYTTSPD
ncbi:MAG: YfiR family protein [Hydrogenophilaceae bacterium]|nr:YfiR family protein [Hydrogenophilaceae bacterium]